MNAILCIPAKTVTLVAQAFWSLLLAFVGVLFALWYENIGRPSLKVTVTPTRTNIKSGDLNTRFLSLKVQNVPKRAPLVRRQTAIATYGKIVFMDSGYATVARPLHVRWDGKAECIKYLAVNGQVVPMFDPSLVRQGRYIDIPPDEAATLAIAFRIAGEEEAFGWSNESYAHPHRKNPDFRLLPGDYIARVSIFSGDSPPVQKDFRFSNPPGAFDGFEFEQNKPSCAG